MSFGRWICKVFHGDFIEKNKTVAKCSKCKRLWIAKL